jgi:hypothetical protein
MADNRAAGHKRVTYENRNKTVRNNRRHSINLHNSNANSSTLSLAQKPSIKGKANGTRKIVKATKKPGVNFDKLLEGVPNSRPIHGISYAGVKFYYIKLDGFQSFLDKYKNDKDRGLNAVVLDNDETTGFYTTLLDYVKKHVKNKKDHSFEAVVDEIKDILESTKSLRAGYEEFLLTLMKLKDEGLIDAVIMYTNMGQSASIEIGGKRYNRPHLLAAVFDKIINKDGKQLFDLLIFRDDNAFMKPEKYITVINKIYNVDGRANKYLFLDDKPEVIFNNDKRTISKFAKKIEQYKYYKGPSFKNEGIIDMLYTEFLPSKKNENSAAKANSNAKAEEA